MPGIGTIFETFYSTGISMPAESKTYDLASDTSKLLEYFLSWTQRYNDLEFAASSRDKPSPSAENRWTDISTQIAAKFASDRWSKAYPKGSGAVSFVVGLPIPPMTGIGSGATPVLIGKNEKRDKIQKNTEKWFKNNWIDAVQRGKKHSEGSFGKNGVISFKQPMNTVPSKDFIKGVEDAWNAFYKGAKFGAEGVSIPDFMKEGLNSNPRPEYFPFLAPHKDAEGNEGPDLFTGERKGAAGWVIGPYSRAVEIEEIKGQTVKITDGGVIQEVPKFQVVTEVTDNNEFLVDNAIYREVIISKVGTKAYNTFRTQEPVYTNLPFNAAEIKQPIFGLPPDYSPETIEFDANDNPIPSNELSYQPKLYGLGWGSGRIGGLTARHGNSLRNDNFGQPLVNPAYGIADVDEFNGTYNNYKTNTGAKIIGSTGQSKAQAWGSTIGGKIMAKADGEGKNGVLMGHNQIKDSAPALPGNKVYSYSDPRTWGPFEEFTGTGNTDLDGGDLKYKYIIPTGFSNARSAASTGETNNGQVAGVPKTGEPIVPVMNKAYWGLRLEEVFPPPKDPIEEISKPPPAGVVVDGAGGFRDGTTYVCGPAPPMTCKQTGGSFGFKWSHDKVLYKNGNLKRTHGTIFKRNSAQNQYRELSSAKFPSRNQPVQNEYEKMSKHLPTVKKELDKKVKGKASGGMTFSDATKQILFPYTPPPLKPPLPNNKSVKWNSGVL